MITLNIARIAAIKGVQQPYTFLVKHGFTPQMTKSLLSGRSKRLHFGHLEKLCRLFRCEPYDLFDYRPDSGGLQTEHDRLAFLAKPAAPANFQQLIAQLSLKEMEALVADVSNRFKAA